jgi:cellulose synthase/poly-beta-1,6-N-acetylglucosamine synthase-like glycosyltransferase
MITTVGVVIPANDEQDEILGCLNAVDAAVDHLTAATSGRVRVHVVVVLDDCRDRTAEAVATFRSVTTLVTDARSVGVARRVGATHLLSPRLQTEWIANTDADSRVHADWLTRMISHADAGADLVLGTVRPSAGLPPSLHASWLDAHNLGDGHPHVYGANLGIRTTTYRDLGGWSPLTTGEDTDLVERSQRHHLRIQRCGDVIVTTSSRPLSRVPHGFATYLRHLKTTTPTGNYPSSNRADER